MQYYTLIFLPKENNIFRKFNILFISTLIKFTNKNYQNRYMSEEDHRVTFHMYSLTFAWFFLSTIALWGIAFKHTKIGFYLHAICYGLAGLITISAVPLVIFKSGLDLRLIPDNIPYVYHNIAGFSTLCLIIFVMCFGAATKLNQMTPKTPTSQIRTVSLIHKILGSLILITSRIALYTQWSSNDPLIFKGMVGVDAISFGGLFLKKVFPKTVQAVNDKQVSKDLQKNLRKIRSNKDLQIYSNNYVIFADRLYDTEELMGSHPGGWEIMKCAQGREVDRFLYGVQPLQILNDIPAHSHTVNSLSLLGDPIAKLDKICIFEGIQDINECSVCQMEKFSDKSPVFIVRVCPKNNFKYQGYTHLSELGQYYSLTIDDSKTRLYTNVNFLQKQNLKLMASISSNMKVETQQIKIDEENQKNQGNVEIPLMIKRYDDGYLTSSFLKEGFSGKLRISKPRGRGLALNEKQQGKIIFFAGGTGLFPFSDTIDLLFKDLLIEQRHSLSNTMQENDQLLVNRHVFSLFEFSLYLAINDINQVHPITLYQLDKLSESKNMITFIRTKSSIEEQISKKYKHLNYVEDYFDSLLQDLVKQRNMSQIYMCGPTRFTKRMVEGLSSLGISNSKYSIL